MTTYIEPTNDEIRRWQDKGLCVHCGLDSDDKCRCRYCDSCSQTWLADTLASYVDSDFGPQPRREDCPDCKVLNDIDSVLIANGSV